MTPKERRLYKTTEVADLLSVCLTKAKELVGTGQIASVKIGRSVRVPAEALDEYIERLKAEAATKDLPKAS